MYELIPCAVAIMLGSLKPVFNIRSIALYLPRKFLGGTKLRISVFGMIQFRFYGLELTFEFQLLFEDDSHHLF